MTSIRDVLRSTRARAVMQVSIILALVVVAWQVYGIREEATINAQTAAAVNSILAQSCGAASFAELREQGLVEECRLAQDGDLVDAIPEADLPEPDAKPDEVEADLVEDDETSTPADVQPIGPTDAATAAAVAAYFDRNPISAQPGYQRAISRTVTTYLSANPPPRGRPPTEGEIRDAVRAALLANPPADGEDGAEGEPGRSVTSALLDGCDVVFTYSDGSTDRVGPVCGADGEPGPAPTDEQVAQAVVAYCQSNGECRGPAGPPGVVQTADECQPGEGRFVTDVNISGPVGDPATITITCETATVLGNGGVPRAR